MIPNSSPRVDAYIEQAAPFAQPILNYLRAVIHETCPDVTETIKWSFVAFEYKGPFCSMAAFKEHCGLGFWKSPIMNDPSGILEKHAQSAMGNIGRITSLEDLPSKEILIAFLHEAMRLNDAGIKVPKEKSKVAKRDTKIPAELTEALLKNPVANQVFQQFSESKRRDYAEWIAEAKSESTRNKRITTAIEWIAEGKGRNWKYEK